MRPIPARYAGSVCLVSAATVNSTAAVTTRFGSMSAAYGCTYASGRKGPNIDASHGIHEAMRWPNGMHAKSAALTTSDPRKRPPR
jgi:hypothetical protein